MIYLIFTNKKITLILIKIVETITSNKLIKRVHKVKLLPTKIIQFTY